MTPSTNLTSQMTNVDLDRWFRSDLRRPLAEWQDFRARYLDDRDLEEVVRLHIDHPIFELNYLWLRLLPEGATSRLRSDADLDEVIPDLVSGMLDNLLDYEYDHEIRAFGETSEGNFIPDGDKRMRIIEAALCLKLTSFLTGSIDLERAHSGDVIPSRQIREADSGPGTIVLSRLGPELTAEYLVYELDDMQRVFGPRYGDQTEMVRNLIQSGSEPEMEIDHVVCGGYDAPDPGEYELPWPEATLPNHPISMYGQPGSDFEFRRVERPGDVVDDDSGVVNTRMLWDAAEHLHTASSVDYHITMGLCE